MQLNNNHLEVPVESSDVDAGGVAMVILHGGVVDHVDDRTHDIMRVAGNAVQQGLEPT